MKNNHRLTTAINDGGGDTTDRAACALALVADTPTPNAYAPVARWPSTSDTVFQVTVYTPVPMGFSGTSSSSGCAGTATVGPASTLSPEPLTTVMLERRGSGVSPKVISTSAGAVCTSDPSGGNRTLRKGMGGHCRRERKSGRPGERRADRDGAPDLHAYALRRRSPMTRLAALSSTATTSAMTAMATAPDALLRASAAAVAASCALANAAAAR